MPFARPVSYPCERGDCGRGGLLRRVPRTPARKDDDEVPPTNLLPLAGFLEQHGARIVETKPITAWAFIWRSLIVLVALIAFPAAIFVPMEYL